MAKVWIKLWKADLLSSSNYKTLNISCKGIYNILMTICRDEEYAGEFCYPDGKAMSIDKIIEDMGVKKGDRTDRIKIAIEEMIDPLCLLFYNERGVLEIRKYAKKTGQLHLKSAGGCQEVVKPDSGHKPKANDGLDEKSKKPPYKDTTTDTDTDTDTQQNVPENPEEINCSSSLGLLRVVKGFKSIKLIDIASTYPYSKIKKAVKMSKNKDNPAGFIVSALEKGWV